MLSLRLELRLDESQQMHRRGRKRECDRQHGFQRNETDIDHDDVGPRRQALALELANIGLLHGYDPGMAAQRAMQLLTPDIDRKHKRCAIGEQHLGEPAGRGTDIETDMAFDIDRVMLQRAGELDAAARDVGVGGLRLEGCVGGQQLRRLANLLVVCGDEAGLDCRARPRAALEQATLDQQYVHAFGSRGHQLSFRTGCTSCSAALRTQNSNAVKSCQRSAGACCGTTSGQPWRSRAWINIRLSVRPKSSTESPSASTRWPSRVFTAPNRRTRAA